MCLLRVTVIWEQNVPSTLLETVRNENVRLPQNRDRKSLST